MDDLERPKRVQVFGRKKTAVAVAVATPGTGSIKVDGVPLELVTPEALRVKCFEPILILHRRMGENNPFRTLNLRLRVKGGGSISRIYAIRQAIAKAAIAFNQKFVDEATKRRIRDELVAFDRSLIVADPRRCEPKKFGGRGARARFQKSYR